MRTPILITLVVASLLCSSAWVAVTEGAGVPGPSGARTSGLTRGERVLLERGVAALAAHDLPTAGRLLTDVYRQSLRSEVLYHLARLAAAEARPLAAYDLMRRYLADPSREPDEAATRAAEEVVSQPPPPSGSVLLSSDPGALVLLDNRVVATLPLLLPLLVEPGPHTVKLEFPSKGIEAPVQVELGRLTEVRMSRSSGAVLVSVLPAILLCAADAGLPTDLNRPLAEAVEQAARDAQYTLLRADILLPKAEQSQRCLATESCQRELAATRKLELVLQQRVQVQGSGQSRSFSFDLRLLRLGYAEPASASQTSCDSCSSEQAATLLKEATTKLLARGLERPHGSLRVTATPAAATLRLGDQALAPAPHSELLWEGGYTVTASHPGFAPGRYPVEVTDGKLTELQVALQPTIPQPQVPPPVLPRPPPRSVRPRWRLAVGGTALGVGLGLSILGGLGLSADSQCTTPPEVAAGTCPQLYDTAAVGGAALGIGVALVGSGVVLLALPGPSR